MARRAASRYDETRQSTSSGPKDFGSKDFGSKVFGRAPSRFFDIFFVAFWALIFALLLRTFLFQPFYIPSHSMAPNIVKGDYVITSKYAYGYGGYSALPLTFPELQKRVFRRAPRRGDVAVFRDERTGRNIVKRIIAFEGERVRLENERVFINDAPVQTQSLEPLATLDPNRPQLQRREGHDNGVSYVTFNDGQSGLYDNLDTVIVPQGHYYVLGDNRDNSADSRVAKAAGGTAMVSENELIGRAEFILLSVSDNFSLKNPLTWHNVRRDRFFKDIP